MLTPTPLAVKPLPGGVLKGAPPIVTVLPGTPAAPFVPT